MPDFDIDSASGEQFVIGGQVTKPLNNPPEPPPWPGYPNPAGGGYTIVFTAKRKPADTTPLVQRTGTLADGGAWTVTIDDGDTHDFTKTEDLAYDVVLNEPDGSKTVVSRGRWTVAKSVGL